MDFQPKLWKDRDAEHLNRRVLTPVTGGSSTSYNVDRDEGIVFEEGDLLDAGALNGLEARIAGAVNSKADRDRATAPGETGTYAFVFMEETQFANPSNPQWEEIPLDKRINGAILAIKKGF